MAGIVSDGVYLPLWRLRKETLSKGARGERTVTSYDEDSVTMAVAAARNCLKGRGRETVDALLFASTTFPYLEKQAAALVASAIDLRPEVLTLDFAGSLRSGTSACKLALDMVNAGTARQVLVVAADCRLGAPGSRFERNCGSGAAALLIGNSEIAVEVKGFHTISNEILDIWRPEGERFLRTWEDRFVLEKGFLNVVPKMVSPLLAKSSLSPEQFTHVIFTGMDRSIFELAESLGFAKTQVQDPLFDSMGNTGTPYPLMLCIAALEDAKPGEQILLTSYGDGADGLVLLTTELIGTLNDRRGMKSNLQSKKLIPDYTTYLQWEGILDKTGERRPLVQEPSASGMAREQAKNIRFHGVRCKVCGQVLYPITRVCARCQSKDQFDEVPLADEKGELFTYSIDYLSSSLEPLKIGVINLEGGARLLCYVADVDVGEMKIGIPVEMSFRKLFQTQGIHNYYWKATPVRFNS